MKRIAAFVLALTAMGALPACSQTPASQPWVASARGEVYYWSRCSAAQRIPVENRRYFAGEAEARAAGYRRSTARGCDGPNGGARARNAPPASPAARKGTPPTASAQGRTCTVASVQDGDTLTCADGTRVRLLLIDAPEMSQGPYGKQAREALSSLARRNMAVRLESDVQPQDRYRRSLAYVWLPDGRMANEEMARQGYVLSLTYPPNVRHVERIRRAIEQARAGRRGLWATFAFQCAPRDHRAERC